MLTVKENTTFVGVSELRTRIDEVLKKARQHKVIIEKRNKPVAAFIDIRRYNEMEKMLDAFEDLALGSLSREREENSRPSDYLPVEKIEED